MSQEKRREDWIYINTPQNKQMIASPAYVKKLLEIEQLDVGFLYRRLQDLENRIQLCERPQKKQRILELLADGSFHNNMWIENRLSNVSYWLVRDLLTELISEHKLATRKSGTQTLYGILNSEEASSDVTRC